MSEEKIVKTSCGICGGGCLVNAHVKDGKMISVEGFGRMTLDGSGVCAKGAAAPQFLYNKERILYPMKRIGEKGEGRFERISWDEAFDMIAENLLRIREDHGAKHTVFYSGYPKWNRPALLRLANAYGSPNSCTESSTCFQAADLAWRAVFGNHICPPDFAHAKTVLIWSSNLYHSNTPMSRMYQGLKERGVHIIDVDPRHTVTAHDAELHLQLIPGTDGALALSMGHVIIEEGLYDREFVEKYVHGFEEYAKYVRQFTPERAQQITGVLAEQIRKAAIMYASSGPAAIMFSASPVVHHINGVQNYRAVFALCAITGNYDIEGGNRSCAGPVSPVNEYGMVKRFDKEEAIGQSDFPVWFDLSCEEAQCSRLADYILEEKPYKLRAVFAMGLNHRMWPSPERLKEALKKLDFYVNIDFFLSDSSYAADLVLPANTTFERDEVHALRGGRFYYSNRAVEPLGEAKNDIEIIIEVLRRMHLRDEVLENGYEAYMEHILKPSGLSLAELRKSPEGMRGKVIFPPSVKTYESRPFATPSGKVELRSLVLERNGYEGLPVYCDYREAAKVSREEYPLILNTGSRKPQFFHSRFYRVPWLAKIEAEPMVELHPEDAEKYQIEDGDCIKVISPAGQIEGTALYNISGKPGVVYVYHGCAKGDANELIDKDYLDPISGFPGFKGYFCKIEKVGE